MLTSPDCLRELQADPRPAVGMRGCSLGVEEEASRDRLLDQDPGVGSVSAHGAACQGEACWSGTSHRTVRPRLSHGRPREPPKAASSRIATAQPHCLPKRDDFIFGFLLCYFTSPSRKQAPYRFLKSGNDTLCPLTNVHLARSPRAGHLASEVSTPSHGPLVAAAHCHSSQDTPHPAAAESPTWTSSRGPVHVFSDCFVESF